MKKFPNSLCNSSVSHVQLLLLLQFSLFLNLVLAPPPLSVKFSSAKLLIKVFTEKLAKEVEWPSKLNKAEWEAFKTVAKPEEVQREYDQLYEEGKMGKVTVITADDLHEELPKFMDKIWTASEKITGGHSEMMTGYFAFYQLSKLVELLAKGFNERGDEVKEVGTFVYKISSINQRLVHMREVVIEEMGKDDLPRLGEGFNSFNSVKKVYANKLLGAAGVKWPIREMHDV